MTVGLAEMAGARPQKCKGCMASLEKEVGRGDSYALTGHLAWSAAVGA